MTLPITLLTDYGNADEFAGACRLVIERLTPGAHVIDLTHGIPPGDVRRGALALEQSARVGPRAVHLAVVDPGVGTARRGVAVASGDGSLLVGPDNGLLTLALEARGGAVAAVDVSTTALRLEPASATFHGRDIFAPVAAHLAAGRPLAAAGDPFDPGDLVALELPTAIVQDDRLHAHVLYADGFGNLILDARPGELRAVVPGAAPLAVSAPAGRFAAVRGRTFADGSGDDGGEAGEALVVYDDSAGRLGVAVDRGSAAELLGAARDDELILERAP